MSAHPTRFLEQRDDVSDAGVCEQLAAERVGDRGPRALRQSHCQSRDVRLFKAREEMRHQPVSVCIGCHLQTVSRSKLLNSEH